MILHGNDTDAYGDGAFRRCPVCSGPLRYSDDTTVVCDGCTTEFVHVFRPDGRNRLERAHSATTVLTVYDPQRDDTGIYE